MCTKFVKLTVGNCIKSSKTDRVPDYIFTIRMQSILFFSSLSQHNYYELYGVRYMH